MVKSGSSVLQGFFAGLNTFGWALYVPQRVFEASRAGILPVWGISEGRLEEHNFLELMRLLKKKNISSELLRIPRAKELDDWVFDRSQEGCSNGMEYDQEAECIPLPVPNISDEDVWNDFIRRLRIENQSRSQLLIENCGNVYHVRFFPISIKQRRNRKYEEYLDARLHDDSQKKEMLWEESQVERERLATETQELKNKFGFSLNTASQPHAFNGSLAVLLDKFPTEQVTKTRRQIEDRLRKSPVDVIRMMKALSIK